MSPGQGTSTGVGSGLGSGSGLGTGTGTGATNPLAQFAPEMQQLLVQAQDGSNNRLNEFAQEMAEEAAQGAEQLLGSGFGAAVANPGSALNGSLSEDALNSSSADGSTSGFSRSSQQLRNAAAVPYPSEALATGALVGAIVVLVQMVW